MSPKSYITTTNGLSGYYAVLLVWDSELVGFDIMQTGVGRYATREEAEGEAKSWAEDESLEFRE